MNCSSKDFNDIVGFFLCFVILFVLVGVGLHSVSSQTSYYTNYKTYTLVNIDTRSKAETNGHINGGMILGTGAISGSFIQRENDNYTMYVREISTGLITRISIPIHKAKFKVSNSGRVYHKRELEVKNDGDRYYTSRFYYEIHIPEGSIQEFINLN